MDYARLRAEGLELLGRLAGAQWTDFNTHDPGITILEQLCYAITDLGYRIAYPMTELLSGGDPGLPAPEAILTSDPVTPADLQKLALDVDGIGNAWVEDWGSELPFYHDAASSELRLRAGSVGASAVPVPMRGLHRIVVQATERISNEAGVSQVAARLHAARGLGSDLAVATAGITQVSLRATLEIGAVDDPVQLMAAIVDAIETYLAPKARFLSLAEARAQSRPLDEILEGPLLDHGFVERLPVQPRTVYVSDLLHAILDVPGVKAVRSLVLPGSSTGGGWSLEIPPGTVATLAPAAELTLFHDDLPVPVDPGDARDRLDALRRTRAIAAAPASAADDAGPGGSSPRPRDLTRYRSIQYQLPAAYGVGSLGLPSSAPPERRAQSRQLATYLLIFDQLFATALAQLAHARELLSPAAATTPTYFAPPVEDARLGLDELRLQDPARHRAWLDAAIETGDPIERRKRFLAHLLARFAEELGDHARSGAGEPADAGELLVADRQALLRDYPRLSRARGSGYDVGHHGDPDAVAGGYEDRLRHKLGLGDPVRLHVVEHVLLRPVAEDRAQLADEGDPQVPLLAGVARADPWSLAISVVLEEPAQPDAGFAPFVAQTIAAETPAHLAVRLHWFGKTGGVDDWAAFEAAWGGFRTAHRTYRETKFRGAIMPTSLQLQLRDARDRVIDALSYVDSRNQQAGLGRTYPLRDLPLPEQIVVAPGGRAKISIAYSQQGVTYELCDRDTGQPIQYAGAVIAADGTGGPIELVTPAIEVDASYRILAVKREGAQTPELRREAWLRTVIHVVEGVDASLVARLLLPALDARIDNPRPTDARLGDWGVEAEIEIPQSQEGVTYVVIEDAKDLSDVTRHTVISAQEVIGTSGRIVLRTVPIHEDIDLRVRGQKVTGTATAPVTRTAILDLVLPLRVRANPAASAQLVPPVVAYSGDAVVRLGATQASQASTEYRVHRGRVRDGDFVFGTGTQVPTIDVPGDGRTVRIQRPAKPSPWQDLAGFAPVGEAAHGTGGALDLTIGAPGTDDSFLLVQATKQHQTGRLGTGSEQIPSAVQLDAALALLARPNPAPALRLEVAMAAGATTGALRVTGGQPGVYYEFRLDGQTQPIGRPAYFHQRDDRSDQINKGIDQLRIEVDAAVARDRPEPAGSPVTTPPPAPLLETALLPAGSVLRVVARKAMSGLEAPLARLATLDDMPAVTLPAPVPRGTSADIVIETSRLGERYWLTQNGQPVGEAQVGTGARIALPTAAIAERTVFTLVATRPGDQALAVERHVDVTVDMIEVSLQANLLLPLLDPRISTPRPGDARLGNWGVQAEVEILASQDGVTYALIEDAADLGDVTAHRVVSAQEIVATSGRIVLRTVPIQEDLDLRIRGQKTAGTSTDPRTGLAILDVVLPLRVRANPAATAQLVPPVVAYGGASVLRLGATQASVAYGVHRGRVRDADFVFDAGAQTPTIDVPGDDRTVRIQRPAKSSPWQDLAGFAPVGEAARGTGGALDLAIGAPGTDDAFLLVQATKQHQTGRLGTGSEQIPSAVQLDAALALLARPDPARALRLAVTMAAGATTGALRVTGGQPGVFYEFRLDGQTQPIGRPAYFHQRDDQSDLINKGIDQLRIEVDAAVARDRPEPAGNPVTTPPAAPLLDTASLPAGSLLRAVARKAMSGLEAPLGRLATLDDTPAVTQPAPVPRGTSADIVIETSRQGERYWLTHDGEPVGGEQVGTGARIALPTGEVAVRTVFTLAAARPDEQAIAVDRHVEVVVEVIAAAAPEA
jgi:hypothetical protein